MTSPQPTTGAHRAVTDPPDPASASTGELVGQLSAQLSPLVRDEVRPAQGEVTQKATPPLPNETIAGVQTDIKTLTKAVAR